MDTKFVRISSYDLIGESEDGGFYRHVIFEDLSTKRKADYIVYQDQRPALWNDIESLEKGKDLPPYKGYIAKLNEFDILVLGDESLHEAFENQRWKFEKKKKLGRDEADSMRKNTKGFCTDLSYKNSMQYSWKNISPNAKKVKFRYYTGKGTFSWSSWYKIED